ncbi:MAG: hypothetical protein E6J91_04955 [Deltaproteobacteria bacterium]|nr:MAG: hypothetical protein E6J91_04955 [Deltaproteobacteria bacterium]
MSDTNRTLVLRIADTAALVATCAATGGLALKLGVTPLGIGMLALGAAFLADDLWRAIRPLRVRVAGGRSDAVAWRRPAVTSGPIALPPNGR